VITAFEFRSRTKQRAIAAAIALLLGACSTNASRREADFDVLRHSLPGIYASAPAAVRLAITPFIAQAVGDHLYFVRQTAVGNEHLVLAERIWMLTLDKQNRLIQQMFVFKDPRRWLGAAEHRDLLLGMLPEDLTALSGCELIWERSASGFTAEPMRTPDLCDPGSTVQGQWLERELKLEGAQLSLNERQVDSDGALSASAGVTALTLQRRASAPGPTRSPF
jgi:CpeT/CpcT family (DUF1001)